MVAWLRLLSLRFAGDNALWAVGHAKFSRKFITSFRVFIYSPGRSIARCTLGTKKMHYRPLTARLAASKRYLCPCHLQHNKILNFNLLHMRREAIDWHCDKPRRRCAVEWQLVENRKCDFMLCADCGQWTCLRASFTNVRNYHVGPRWPVEEASGVPCAALRASREWRNKLNNCEPVTTSQHTIFISWFIFGYDISIKSTMCGYCIHRVNVRYILFVDYHHDCLLLVHRTLKTITI